MAVIMSAVSIAPVVADWPSSLEVGGFKVSDIRGTMDDNGSGRATGKLALPGGGSTQVDLACTSAEVITASCRSGFTIANVRIDGTFLLDRRGMQGTGTINTKGKPISDANITVDPKRGVTGRGKVHLGSGFSVPVNFEISTSGVSVKGSAPRQASVDTPLALYTFKGNVTVSSSGTALKTTATGSIERTGKIGGMVSTFGPITFEVNPQTGDAQVNIGGANITIELW